MNIEEYQKLAARTECVQVKSLERMVGGLLKVSAQTNEHPLLCNIRLNHCIIGLAGEIGELSEVLIDPKITGLNQLTAKLIEEGGDCLWYIAEGCNALGLAFPSNYGMMNLPGTVNQRIETLVSRMVIHLGRLASFYQKLVYYGKAILEGALKPVVGLEFIILADCLHNIFLLIGTSMPDVMENNIAKLKVRYPEKYTDWNAADENRDRDAEAKAYTPAPMDYEMEQDGHGFGHARDIGVDLATGESKTAVAVAGGEPGVTVEMAYPYCGGCGHRFHAEAKLPEAEAEKRSETRRCHYCLDDARQNQNS